MHYDWCMKQPQASVQGAEANIRRLVSMCTANVRRPQRSTGGKWSGEWRWVRPLMVTPNPGPQDTTVRSRTTAAFELQPNSRVKICVSTNPCNVYAFTYTNGMYNIDTGGAAISVVTNDQGRTLNGQFWWRKENRTRTTPDATFTLR